MTMRTQMRNMKRRVQRGFTLVELAIVLVIAGLILVAVLRGTDAIQKAQVERMVSDLRGLQGMLLEFQKRNGRLPGDCNNNGVMSTTGGPGTNQNPAPIVRTLLPGWTGEGGDATVLWNNPAHRQILGAPVATRGAANVVCADALTAREDDINLPWNEMRRAGIVDSNRLPRELARHSMGDVFLISTMWDAAANGGQPAGIIVVYGIPIWMAEAVDASIDGAATLYGTDTGLVGPANTGRVRLWAGPVATGPVVDHVFTATQSAANASYHQRDADGDRDRLISISFQYTPNKLVR